MKREIIEIFFGFNAVLIFLTILSIKAYGTDINTFYLSIGFIILDILYQIQFINDIRKYNK